jgi:putative transposase
MIEAVHADLSISAQCRLLSISRSSFYYAPQPESEETLALMRVIDATFLDMPWYGSRQMVRHLRRQGVNIGRRRVQQLMTKMGLSPIYQRPRTSGTRNTGFIRICCNIWWSSGQTRSALDGSKILIVASVRPKINSIASVPVRQLFSRSAWAEIGLMMVSSSRRPTSLHHATAPRLQGLEE